VSDVLHFSQFNLRKWRRTNKYTLFLEQTTSLLLLMTNDNSNPQQGAVYHPARRGPPHRRDERKLFVGGLPANSKYQVLDKNTGVLPTFSLHGCFVCDLGLTCHYSCKGWQHESRLHKRNPGSSVVVSHRGIVRKPSHQMRTL
jgi:hypothetical protein